MAVGVGDVEGAVGSDGEAAGIVELSLDGGSAVAAEIAFWLPAHLPRRRSSRPTSGKKRAATSISEPSLGYPLAREPYKKAISIW